MLLLNLRETSFQACYLFTFDRAPALERPNLHAPKRTSVTLRFAVAVIAFTS